MLVGCVLFLTTGSLVVEHHGGLISSTRKSTGIAMGSLAIINGIVMFADVLLIGKAIKGRTI